jgi:hypothetical protein
MDIQFCACLIRYPRHRRNEPEICLRFIPHLGNDMIFGDRDGMLIRQI